MPWLALLLIGFGFYVLYIELAALAILAIAGVALLIAFLKFFWRRPWTALAIAALVPVLAPPASYYGLLGLVGLFDTRSFPKVKAELSENCRIAWERHAAPVLGKVKADLRTLASPETLKDQAKLKVTLKDVKETATAAVEGWFVDTYDPSPKTVKEMTALVFFYWKALLVASVFALARSTKDFLAWSLNRIKVFRDS